jgi:hypothetical protein
VAVFRQNDAGAVEERHQDKFLLELNVCLHV